MCVSVLILTFNEEINIADCLKSLSWSDDIVVLDSFSNDNTVAIAREMNARVLQRAFDNWSDHQNWALNNIEFKYQWVLYFDADERCTHDLKNEVLNAVANSELSTVAYRVRRKDFYMGTWLKRAQLYPTWLVRLFRPKKITFERLVNPIAIVSGETASLQGHILHYPFSHGVGHWINRHNKYSDMEALEWIKSRQEKFVVWKTVFSSDPAEKRRALKEIFYRLPARPLIKFIYYYFVRLGMFDGRAGFAYSVLQAIYEYMIQLKVSEIDRKSRKLPL